MPPESRYNYVQQVHGLELAELNRFGEVGNKLKKEIIELDIPLTPHGELAAAREAISPEDLQKKPIEAFEAKGLPRDTVVKMYVHYEARRRDLVANIRKTRQEILNEADKNASIYQSTAMGASPSRHAMSMGSLGEFSGALNALTSVMTSQPFELEREKFGRAMTIEKKWLKAALQVELARCRELQASDNFHTEEDNNNLEEMRAEAIRRKKLADKRRAEADFRAEMEEEERRRDREEAKRNFRMRQSELAVKEHREREMARKRYESQLDAERKKMEYVEYQEQKKREREELIALAQENQAREDMLRKEELNRRKDEIKRSLDQKSQEKTAKIERALKQDRQLTLKKLRDYEIRQEQQREKEERMEEEKRRMSEMNAIRQKKLIMKRENAALEAQRRLEEMQNNVLDRARMTEDKLNRLRDEKDKEMAAKKEYDYLREASREYNLERMRKKDEFRRETVAEHTALKMARSRVLEEEKRLMQQERRRALDGSFKARLAVREMIHNMKIKSKFNPRQIEHLMEDLTNDSDLRSLFHPYDPSTRILNSVAQADRPGTYSPLPARQANVAGSPLKIPGNGNQNEGGTIQSPPKPSSANDAMRV